MTKSVQLNYDELRLIVKGFKNEGECIVSLLAKTRQKLHDLETEWIGEGSEKFFNEMETRLIPALQRTSQALFASEEVLIKITRIISEADKETASYFKHDLFEFNKPEFIHFNGILEHLGGSQSIPGATGLGSEGSTIPGQIGGSAGLEGSAFNYSTGGFESPDQTEGGNLTETQNTENGAGGSSGNNASSTGGTSSSGSSGSSSSGGSGDLNNMGSGVGAQVSSAASGLTGGAPSVGTDHIYEGSSSNGTSGGNNNNAGNTAGSVGQPPADGEGAAAAGAAVIGSVSMGAAAKAVRGHKK